MKKFIVYLLVFMWGVGVMSFGIVYAGDDVTIDDLLPTVPQDLIDDTKKELASDTDISKQNKTVYLNWIDRISDINKLPKGSPESIIAGVISMILGIGGTLAMIAMVVAGVMYIIAQDNEEMVNSAKKIITYALIGLIVISVSFAIFTGLSKLFF